MADLGNKFECVECGTKFYDLGKSRAICPKCDTDQKKASKGDSAPAKKPARRKRAATPAVPEVVEEVESAGELEEVATEEVDLEEE